jgi:glycosyltransferase involved in cell wall biosynthesis
MTKVSILIPSFNQEAYLAEAIESALSQTHPCEIIIVDDGSTDGSLMLAQQYEPEVKVVRQVNKGLASARNTGIMNASGDYILPLDADDILLPNCVERLLQVAKETEADVIGPSFQCFGVGDTVVILHPQPTLAHFRVGNHLGYFSLIKKAALLEIGGYSSRMVEGYEDLHLWVNLLSRGKRIETVPEVLVKYRTKSVSMWKNAVKNHHVKLMEQIYKDFPTFLPV